MRVFAGHDGARRDVFEGFPLRRLSLPVHRFRVALAAALLLAGCAANLYADIPLEPGAADAMLQDEVRRAMAGDKHAQLALGIRFEEGSGLPIDYRKAKELYQLAAKDRGGKMWVYSPPLSKNDKGRTLPINRGPKVVGLEAAKVRLAGLRSRVVEREKYR
jgi:TPR repeat protein